MVNQAHPGERRDRPTMHDVAALAGVSHQTVSRYFRDEGGLKTGTRERIDAAVSRLGYRPNLIARSMRTRRSGRIAVVLPTVAFNPARLLAGAGEAAHDAGYQMDVISLAGGSAQWAMRMPELIASHQFEGVLSFAAVPDGVVDPETTVLVTGDFDEGMRGVGALADGSTVADVMTELVERGHRRFLHIAGDQSFASARARRDVYTESVTRLGVESVGVAGGDWSGESGYDAIVALTDDVLPLAVLAANDLVAAGAMRAALKRGWRVPDDLSIIGWDDEPIGRFLSPPLSTVAVDLENLGRNAMRTLVGRIRGHAAELDDRPLNTIIWRESVGPVGR